MWIETALAYEARKAYENSFASNGECGLKHWSDARLTAVPEFIRQQWRMWIETSTAACCFAPWGNSFASNGECGLKQTGGLVERKNMTTGKQYVELKK